MMGIKSRKTTCSNCAVDLRVEMDDRGCDVIASRGDSAAAPAAGGWVEDGVAFWDCPICEHADSLDTNL